MLERKFGDNKMESSLKMRPVTKGTWQSCWAKLDHSCLRIFSSTKETLIESLTLRLMRDPRECEGLTDFLVFFGHRSILFRTASSEERSRWMETLRVALTHQSNPRRFVANRLAQPGVKKMLDDIAQLGDLAARMEAAAQPNEARLSALARRVKDEETRLFFKLEEIKESLSAVKCFLKSAKKGKMDGVEEFVDAAEHSFQLRESQEARFNGIRRPENPQMENALTESDPKRESETPLTTNESEVRNESDLQKVSEIFQNLQSSKESKETQSSEALKNIPRLPLVTIPKESLTVFDDMLRVYTSIKVSGEE